MPTTLRRTLAALLPAALAATTFASRAGAQLIAQTDTKRPVAARFGGGFAGLVAQPRDEFADYVKMGGGVGGNFTMQLDPAGVTALRFDVGFLNYGHDTHRESLYGNLVLVDITTTNNIALLGTGLQLQAPRGPLRPYVGGSAGVAFFWTQTSVSGTNQSDSQPFASTTNQSDKVFSLSALGGLYVPVGSAWGIDLGATYHRNGQTTYLRKGSVQDVDGTITITPPIQSETNMLVYRVGVRFGR